MEDVFYEVKKYGASVTVKLCKIVYPGKLEPKSSDMIKSVLGAMGHQHFRVRFACLEALNALVLHGVPLSVIEEIIAPGVAKIVIDPARSVRKACFEFLAGWVQDRMRYGMDV